MGLLFPALVLHGCGDAGDRDARPLTFPFDPCSFVSEADVMAVLPEPVAPGRHLRLSGPPPILVDGMQFCEFTTTAPPNGDPDRRIGPLPWSTVWVGITPQGVSSQFARAALAEFKRIYAVTPVRGIGREAVWSEASGDLVVLLDRNLLGVSVSMGQGDLGQRERATRLAKRVLERLG